jgi:hypothetical protein
MHELLPRRGHKHFGSCWKEEGESYHQMVANWNITFHKYKTFLNPQGWVGVREPRTFSFFLAMKTMILDYCSKNQESMSSALAAIEINKTLSLLPKCYESLCNEDFGELFSIVNCSRLVL